MKFIGPLFLLAIGLATSNAHALLVNCQKATVDVGGVSNTEYFCDDGAAFESPPPLSKYFVLRPDGDGNNPITPFPAQGNKAHCAVNKYGEYHVPPDWSVQYRPEYGWFAEATGLYYVTPGPTAPSRGGPFKGIDAVTDMLNRRTYMYATSYLPQPPEATGIKEMIVTLEHEAAHMNGKKDDKPGDAVGDAAGEAAYASFLAHGGTCP